MVFWGKVLNSEVLDCWFVKVISWLVKADSDRLYPIRNKSEKTSEVEFEFEFEEIGIAV